MPKIVRQSWTESERGWGQRPDGWSIHLTVEDVVAYNENYWADENERNKEGSVPDEYTRPDENIEEVEVAQEVIDELEHVYLRGQLGIRVWQHQRDSYF